MDFLSKLFGVSNGDNSLLKQPGDRAEARVTDSRRKVLKISTDGGKNKYSVTQYPDGTTVETKTTKKR